MTFLLYFFLTFIAVALYFLMLMPVVGYDTLIVEFGVFTITSIIAICMNRWLQFWLPGKKTLQGSAILSFLLEKFYRQEDVFFVFCILTGVALFFVDRNYRITVFNYQVKLTNINNAQNLLDIGLGHFFRFYCFSTVIFLIQSAIKNITDICFLFLLNRKVIAEEPE